MRLFICLTATLLMALGSVADAAEGKPLKVFFLTQSAGFEHSVVKRKGDNLSLAEEIVTKIGKDSGVFETVCSKDAAAITPELLKDLDVMMFYTTGDILADGNEEGGKKKKGLAISKENWDAFDAWLKSGKALVGIHSATDTGKNFSPYYQLINGSFAGHPWGAGTTVTFTNLEPSHPAVAMWEPDTTFKEEIYQYKNYDTKAVRLLLALNMEKTEKKQPKLVPISWVRSYEKGRLFYTNLGHNESTWNNPSFQKHIVDGLKWAAHLTDGPSDPNPEVQAEFENKAKAAASK